MSSEIYRTLMSGKIHRATVTGADLNYVGSITVDANLLERAGILEGERVDVVNVTNGNRLSTYTIAGGAGSGVIQMNGAAAHLTDPGDIVIIISYQAVPESLTANFKGRVVLVDENNQIIDQGSDPGGIPEGLENVTGGPKPLKSPNKA